MYRIASSAYCGQLLEIRLDTQRIDEVGFNCGSDESRQGIFFLGSVLSGKLPEDETLGHIAATLVHVTPYGSELTGGIQMRNQLAIGTNNLRAGITARAALRVDMKKYQLKRVIGAAIPSGRRMDISFDSKTTIPISR